jgi:predicted DNA-binding transcriptional regulator AlpA
MNAAEIESAAHPGLSPKEIVEDQEEGGADGTAGRLPTIPTSLSGESSRRGPPRVHPLQDDPLLDEKEASAYLGGIGLRTLQRWRAANLPPRWVRIGTRAVRYRKSALDAFLAAGEWQALEQTP